MPAKHERRFYFAFILTLFTNVLCFNSFQFAFVNYDMADEKIEKKRKRGKKEEAVSC